MKILCLIFLISSVLPVNRTDAQTRGCTDPVAVNFNQSATINDGSCIYNTASSESFSSPPIIGISQKLHILDLSPFLGIYLNIPEPYPDDEDNFIISPVPAHDFITIRSLPDLLPADYNFITLSGQIVATGRLTSEFATISIAGMNAGIYILKIGNEKRHSYKVIKE